MTGGKCWRGLELASGGSFFSVEAGRWTRAGERRSSEAEQEVRPPPSLFLSRSPLAPLAVMAQAVDFPRVGRNSRARAVDLPRADIIFAPFPAQRLFSPPSPRRVRFPADTHSISRPPLRIRLWRPLESSRRPPDAIRA